MTCKCVYATAENTPSVRTGHEMGGYLKEECDECKGMGKISTADQIRARIESGKLHHDDIKHEGRLTDDEIAAIPVDKVYEWVRTGMWKKKDFNRWLKVMCVIE